MHVFLWVMLILASILGVIWISLVTIGLALMMRSQLDVVEVIQEIDTKSQDS